MDLLSLAKEGKKTFQITFPNGQVVPFRLLSWGEFSTYQDLSLKNTIPAFLIEDTIFNQCVLDQYLIDTLVDLNAGVVSTVVSIIMQLSGLMEISTFNESIQLARGIVDSVNSQIEIVICRAFPAYKPEDLRRMYWGDLLIRLAQAERILMSKNPPELSEPIKLLSAEEQKKQPKMKDGYEQVDVNELVREGGQLARSEFVSPSPENTKPNNDKVLSEARQIALQRRQKISKFRGR